MSRSGLYRGRLWHRRASPTHAFERDVLLASADIAAIDAAPGGVLRLVRGWPIVLRGADHLPAPPDASTSLGERVRSLVAASTGRRPAGPLQLVSQPRAFGLTFDPVSFIYCFDGERIESIVAEVTNTPWGGRHAYVLSEGSAGDDGFLRFSAAKALHVSPFFEMDHEYAFAFGPPGDRLRLSITNRRAGRKVFEAGLSLERIAPVGSAMSRPLLRHAWMPGETLFGIYGQAARLAWKRAPFHPHPHKRPAALAAGAAADARPPR